MNIQGVENLDVLAQAERQQIYLFSPFILFRLSKDQMMLIRIGGGDLLYSSTNSNANLFEKTPF